MDFLKSNSPAVRARKTSREAQHFAGKAPYGERVLGLVLSYSTSMAGEGKAADALGLRARGTDLRAQARAARAATFS